MTSLILSKMVVTYAAAHIPRGEQAQAPLCEFRTASDVRAGPENGASIMLC